MTPLEEFARLVAEPEERLDVEAAAFEIARQEYPNLDVAPYRRQLDAIAARVAARLPAQADPYAALESLSRHLFAELGFRGNRDDYYDPRNSFLNDVLDRRTGIPITLSLVYMGVAQRVGLPLVGIGLPGHFLLRYAGETRAVFVDPFNQGALLTREDCAARLQELFGAEAALEDEHIAPVTKRALLYRLLNNLKAIYAEREDWPKTAAVLDWMLAVDPDDAALIRDRGLVRGNLGQYARAVADLEEYLRRAPDAPDAAEMRKHLRTLAHLRARVN